MVFADGPVDLGAAAGGGFTRRVPACSGSCGWRLLLEFGDPPGELREHLRAPALARMRVIELVVAGGAVQASFFVHGESRSRPRYASRSPA
jgi:hypothetical protein